MDLVVVTGDYPPHDVWRQNRSDNLESSKLVADVLKKHFGGKLGRGTNLSGRAFYVVQTMSFLNISLRIIFSIGVHFFNLVDF